MNLARQAISATAPTQIIDVRFDADAHIFTCSTPAGFAVYRSWPLKLLKRREITDGTLSKVVPLHSSSLLFLVGGGRSPRYPPNKVVFWDDVVGKEVAELEFREDVRGLACRREWLIVALRRRVVVFRFTNTIQKFAEWDTGDNERGLLALSTGPFSTLLAFPGPKMGYLQLIQLPPCPPPPPSLDPDAIPPKPPQRAKSANEVTGMLFQAHQSVLFTIATSPSGNLIATASEQGTLIRIWDTQSGHKVRELRRGFDQAIIYGIAFRPDEREICVWSDKGTVHVFSLDGSSRNRHSAFQSFSAYLAPMKQYLDSEWSYAQYRLPRAPAHVLLSTTSTTSRTGTVNPDAGEDEKCVVAWVKVPVTQPSPASPPRTLSPLPANPKDRTGINRGSDFDEIRSDQRRSPGTIRSADLMKASPKLPKSLDSQEYQLVALTFTGGWYRLSLPGSTTEEAKASSASKQKSYQSSGGSKRQSGTSIAGSTARTALGKEDGSRRRDTAESGERGSTRNCILQEFRRYGRWDGWG